MKRTITAALMLLAALSLVESEPAKAVADPDLPYDVCKEIGATTEQRKEYSWDPGECTQGNTNAIFSDLNGDGTKELIVSYGGGSCGLQNYVFRLDKRIKWRVIGQWCGGEGTKILKSKHNGYRDIDSGGITGFWDGKFYVSQPQ